MIYWDTSCVLKLYCAESDSFAWEKLAVDHAQSLISSALLEAELAFALYRKEAQGELARGGAKHLLRQFRSDTESGRIALFPVGSDVIEESADLARTFLGRKSSVALRTLDGLHLATARLLKCDSLATTDARMREAASALGFHLA
jgi:predicted nucleic acid-binding protein